MQKLARRVLFTFVITFMLARILVYLIMTHQMPDLYLHLGGTHVHHLNYGIFLLSGVGGYLLFAAPQGDERQTAGIVYGIGLALTFDEFGMWLHLGGPYWQRASFDAVVAIASVLALLAFAPSFEHFRTRQWVASVALLVVIGVFARTFHNSLEYADQVLKMKVEAAERMQPK